MGKIKFALGTSVAALIAAGAAIFLTKTPAGKKVAKKMKLEAVELGKKAAVKLQSLKKISQKKYNQVIEQVVDDYTKSKKIAKHQSAAIKKDLKSHWREIRQELKNKPAKAKK